MASYLLFQLYAATGAFSTPPGQSIHLYSIAVTCAAYKQVNFGRQYSVHIMDA